MPFAYYGAKHGLARAYAPPAFGTIIEPFAGAAGYSVFWARPEHRVLLFDKDQRIVNLWRELIKDTPSLVAELDAELRTGRVSHPLLTMARGASSRRVGGISNEKATDWVQTAWMTTRKRLLKVAPLIQSWTIEQADYQDIPNQRAVWFIDPPYQPHISVAGDLYKEGADSIDYTHLAAWSRERQGQVIVCEQEPAEWLPFRPLRRQTNQATGVTGNQRRRTEVVWSRTPGVMLGTDRSRKAQTRAKARRNA